MNSKTLIAIEVSDRGDAIRLTWGGSKMTSTPVYELGNHRPIHHVMEPEAYTWTEDVTVDSPEHLVFLMEFYECQLGMQG